MNKLSYEGLKVDLEIRRRLSELIQLKDELEKNNDLSPLEEQQNKLAIQKINELIGRIRYSVMDKLGVLNKEETKLEKDFPGMVEGEQAHIQYPDLQVGKQPKISETQKPILAKGAFGPDAPKVDVDQKRKDQSFEEANIGGEHIGQVFQLSTNSKPLGTTVEAPDFNPAVSGSSQDKQELTDSEIRVLTEINEFLVELEKEK